MTLALTPTLTLTLILTLTLTRYVEANDPDGNWRKPRMSIVDHHRRLSKQMASMRMVLPSKLATVNSKLPSVNFGRVSSRHEDKV